MQLFGNKTMWPQKNHPVATIDKQALQQSIDLAVEILNNLAAGNFHNSIDTSSDDIVAPLMEALKKSQETLERRSAEGRRASDINTEHRDRFDRALMRLIDDLEHGRLKTRIEAKDYSNDWLRSTAERINRIVDTLEKPLTVAKTQLDHVRQGRMPAPVGEGYSGEIGDLTETLNGTSDLVTQLLTRQGALNNVSTGVMLVDNDRKITYANHAVKRLLKEAEPEIRRHLPKFDADHLIGINIDSFHKNPAHQAKLLADIKTAHVAQLKLGGRTLQVIANPVFDANGKRLGSVAEWVDLTTALAQREKELQLAAENTRIRRALDNVTTNVMIADNDRNIIYMNKSVSAMLGRAEPALRKVFPSFDVSRLIGTNMDGFHRNPAHQGKLLASLKDTHHAQIEVASHTFSLTANPIIDEQNQRLGSVVEWKDRTQEVAIEREISAIVDAANHGDFSQRIDLSNKQGFFLALGEGMNALMKSLSKLVFDIRPVADAVHAATQEIAAGNLDLSQRTEEQAASLEETAASMEQIAATVKQNAENAKQASGMAAAASTIAHQGGTLVRQVVGTMGCISQSSQQIGDVIGVIDSIALQTNILALNAAVEAARAGEHGRGFAVVATEVRDLAQRAAKAAKEIKALIGKSVEKVEDGTQLVSESGKIMEKIIEAVQQVTEFIGHIASASDEQSRGIEQINHAVTQMDQVTQMNAALVEQAAAAAESLEDQANRLSETMQQFRVDPSGDFE